MPSFTSIYLGIIAPAATLIPITVGLWKFKELPKAMKVIWCYVIVAGVTNCLASIFSNSNNLPILHVYTVVEFVLLSWFYALVLPSKTLKRVILILAGLFIIFGFVNALYLQSIYVFNSNTRPVAALLLIVYSLLYLIASSPLEHQLRWSEIPANWANAGILIYFSAALSQFAFSNLVEAKAPHEVVLLIWNLHGTFVILMYILISISFYKCKK
ncbi:hypothetical protein COR50_17755 [Chitinophaga caeni]|uniref:Uncharacterized protein n=1 Tax=Chitinophaga caeni TaxID=2029983 RepID=A0A291QY66_9BACT|nr:hypothetical protein [Chitinophaga caeni]ATL48861.1 hypothetical protein COR50_17755 [Chitinophaga caeni]